MSITIFMSPDWMVAKTRVNCIKTIMKKRDLLAINYYGKGPQNKGRLI